MRYRPGLFIVLLWLGFPAGYLAAQTILSSVKPVEIQLSTGRKQSFEIAAPAGGLVVFEVKLEGGLLAVQSAEAPRRILDLGRGGLLLYAVAADPQGAAQIELSSSEQSKTALVSLEDVTAKYAESDREHLHAAGIAFAKADLTRKRQPDAPDPATALLLYDTASSEAKAAHDVSLARWAMTQKARYLIFQKSSFLETRSLLQNAAALPDDGDESTQALTYKTLSSADYYIGDLPDSIAAAEKAIALYRKTGDVYWQGIVLGNLVSFYGEAGRDDEATAVGREALSDAEQSEDPAGVVFCLTELGTLYREEGNYQLAFETFRSAVSWGESIHYAPQVEAEIEKDLGTFYLDLGLWKEAEEQFRLCLAHAAPDGEAALDARGMLARVLEQHGNLQSALREYGDAIAIAQKQQLKPEQLTLLLNRSATLLRSGRTESAQNDVAEAEDLAGKLAIPALQVDTALARGAVQESACTSCIATQKTYERALALAVQTAEREQEAAARAGLGRIYAARKDYVTALQSIDAALIVVEHSRASLRSHDLAASYFEQRHEWYDFAVATAMELDHVYPGSGYGETAFRYAERSRARTMLDSLGEPGWQDQSSSNASLRERLLANRRQIEKQTSLLLASSNPEKIAGTLHSLYREEDALAAETESVVAPTSSVANDRIASPKDVQKWLLHRGDAMLAFSQGPSQTFRWLITSSSVSVAQLPGRTAMNHRLAPLRRSLVERKLAVRPGEDVQMYRTRQATWERSRDQALAQAGQLLIPALPSSIHHLYIVGEGPLLSLPWGALRRPCGTSVCYIVERYSISNEPSASVAVELAQHEVSNGEKKVLIVADPIEGHNPAALRWAALQPLPGSGREADAIGRFVPGNALLQLRGDKATVENVRLAVRNNLSILHFSTHTILVAGHPELSGVALSSGNAHGTMTKSVLWLRDIPSLHAPALVTLSGCTTQGTNLSGEELSTLTQAFFYAGAQQVIGSIWSVDDEATSTLMAEFYRRLLVEKLSAPEAMRQAQLSMLQHHFALPDWAGFVVDGVQPLAAGMAAGRN